MVMKRYNCTFVIFTRRSPRPMKELKGFERIFLKSGESRDVKFVITKDDLKFYNSELHYVYEPGEFDVMVGPNSRDVQTKSFQAE